MRNAQKEGVDCERMCARRGSCDYFLSIPPPPLRGSPPLGQNPVGRNYGKNLVKFFLIFF